MATVAQLSPARAAALPASTAGLAMGIPPFVYATTFASLCIIAGLIWDISWHKSIGRDGLLSPPHLAIYLGAVVSGLFSGYQVLHTTLAGNPDQKARNVRFWGVFYGSLGALFSIWGALAMLTSAPFDDWWHNTYGLDVTILSPPHTVLGLGIMMVQFGALVAALAMQNRAGAEPSAVLPARVARPLQWVFLVASGLLLVTIYTIGSEFFSRFRMHEALFYQVASGMFPVLLVAVGRASRMPWGATRMAAVYTAVMALMVWVLPLVPAQPLLGPILNHITHLQAFEFPMLLLVPALAVDLLLKHWAGPTLRPAVRNDWTLALVLGAAFTLALVTAQYPMGDFLMSPLARGHFFGQSSWYYGAEPNWEYRYAFPPWHRQSVGQFVQGIGLAVVISALSARVGLRWGRWMTQVQR